METYDKIIIGAGLYGLYSALYCLQKNTIGRAQHILILENDNTAFNRATYINQARVHQGYHYPRSFSTAIKTAGYFDRFNSDYAFCINKEFEQIYATSSKFSWSSGKQFKDFCKAANISCEELQPNNYFKAGMCDGAFRTREYTYDAQILKEYFLEKLSYYSSEVTIKYGTEIVAINKRPDSYEIVTKDKDTYRSRFVLNTTYASSNQILEIAGFKSFNIKYELCEIILCDVNTKLKNIGFTVMDGPFFSIMPFGKTGIHSLTSVTFTPHDTSFTTLPTFKCQELSNGYCSKYHLGNCNECVSKPKTAFPYMANLAKKYLLDDFKFTFNKSLFSMKPILKASEIDDSRPTVIRIFSENPTFVGVLSGKINTVYDLDEVLDDAK